MAYSRCLIMKNKPRIRFKGFTEDWEQRKVNDIFKITRGQVLATSLTTSKKTSQNIYPVYSSQTKNNGLMGYYSEYLFENAITWTTDGANAGTVNFRPGRFYSTNVNGVLINENGYACYAVSEIINKVAYKYVSKVGNPKLMNNVMAEIDIMITANIGELGRISKLIEAYNKLITLHQRKLEKLKLAKKALLQKLFPKNGSKFPELRFKGFADAWEQRKLNDFVTIRRGLTYKPSDIAEKGIRVLRSSNIDEDQFIKSNDDVFVNIDAVNIPFAKNGDILITSANGSSRLVGKHTIINDIAENSTVHGGFMLLAESNNPLFTDALLSSNWYKRFINTYVAGGNGAIGNLSKSDLESQSVMIPSEHEQTKIGQWYGSINQLITLHQRKLDKLQDVKKGLLQKMFV